jgi:hypothetical protein
VLVLILFPSRHSGRRRTSAVYWALIMDCCAAKGNTFLSKIISPEIYIYIYIHTHTVSGGVKTFKTFMHIAIAKENTTNESKLKFVGVIGT